ncbi:alpha/beta fold hydrolase [Paenarthrobacter nitroguajacolicus]|uniref:alpha/beta fold hydrolase n=1 Tax=Paenarthrobacter nitroguajacolicus TaxID=211146 RepID=UPI0015BDD104|nr:alpha/beta hydrolase [Paenarthrobacter nitroguajacolicus]NWL31718.1 alpha/beta hydrolase [Paenarthrobacter nitroguajacolicus]
MKSSTEVDPRPDHEPDEVVPQHDVVCLHGGEGAGEWFAQQLDALGARAWEPRNGVNFDVTGPPGQMDEWVEAASSALYESTAGPAHILASGTAAYGAIMLAALHPEQVKSVILGDPLVDTSVEGFVPTLRRVLAPSLVIAAAPDLDADISIPQSIAGGIRNGVFVIIDNTAVPAHQSRSHSFNEWSRSFMNIAEGLRTVTETQEEHSA